MKPFNNLFLADRYLDETYKTCKCWVYIAKRATPVIQIWHFQVNYICRTCILDMSYTCISTHVIYV